MLFVYIMYFASEPKLSIKSIKSFANTMRWASWVKYTGVHKLRSAASTIYINIPHEKDRILYKIILK